MGAMTFRGAVSSRAPRSAGLALVFALLLWGLAWPLYAASSAAAHVRFRQISVAQGLSQVSAVDVLQDRRGFLWIGTQDGLNRYDGYEFKVYRQQPGNPDSLIDNYVQALAEGADGRLWVGTQNGLCYLDPDSGRYTRYRSDGSPGALRDALVNGLRTGPDGTLYVSTRRGGIQRLRAGSEQFEDVPGLPPVGRRQLLLWIDPDGSLLVAQDHQVLKLPAAGGSAQVWARDALPADQHFLAARPLGDGYVLGSNQSGVFRVDASGQVQTRYGRAEGLPDEGIRALQVDAQGRLWIGTVEGLARLAPDGGLVAWKHVPGDPYALPGDRISALTLDRQGLLWIGTWSGGLARFDALTEHFRVLRGQVDGLPRSAVPALAPGPEDSLWVGMMDRGGLIQLDADGHRLAQYTSSSDPPLQSEDVTALWSEPRGLWVGYGRGGLDLRQADGGLRRFAAGQAPMGTAAVQSLMQDSAGTLWIGTLGDGLLTLCRECAQPALQPVDASGAAGVLGSSINQVLQTRDGRIWITVRRAGLSWFGPGDGRWGAVTPDSQAPLALPHAGVTSLLEDQRGQLWFGSLGGGLCQLDRQPNGDPLRTRCLGEAEGLVSAMVTALREAADGTLWISTTRGLCRMQSGARIECLGDRDPALGLDFFVGAATIDTRGGLHFGSPQGLVSIPKPSEVAALRPEAPLVYTELRIGNRPMLASPGEGLPARAIESAERIELQHDEDLISAEFAALDFRRADSLRYRYRLIGRDTGWIETDARHRNATYTGLQPGSYQLVVEALDGDTPVGSRELAVLVRPPIWLGPWARIGYAALLGLTLVGLVWRFRLRQRERERAQDALAQSEALLKYSLWGSRGELWDADLRSGRLLRRNRLEHLEATRSAPEDTLAGYTPFVHPDDRQTFNEALLACMKGETDLFECSYRTVGVDGSWRWLLSRGRVFARNASGRAIRMVGTTFDITELRANEAALRESEDRLKLALWGSGDELWDIDLAAGRVTRENPLAESALAPQMQFPRLVDYLDYIHPFDRGRLREALIAHIKGESEHFAASYRTRAHGGGWLWILGKGRVVARDANGRATRMVGTNRDVSQLKAVEEDLRRLNEELESRVARRTEALERTNRELQATLDQLRRAQRQLVESEKLAALGGLVAGVAHEINTPLGVGVTAASHLQSETDRLIKRLGEAKMTRQDLSDFLEQGRQSTDLILRNLQRASELVRSFKQVAVDQSSEQRRVFQVHDYLKEILTSLRPRMKSSRVEVDIDCPASIWMDTYPGALYQIIVNLVINSLVHAFGDEGAGTLRIQVREDGDLICLDYSDNGVGMTEAIRRRVFEPFFTTRRGAGGSGLGLHIVYNLTTQVLRGTVHCESLPGAGTRFRLLLPKVAPTAPDLHADAGGP